MRVLFQGVRGLTMATALLLAGCSVASHLPGWPFFGAKEDKTSYLTPPKQIARLRETAETAPAKSPAERERIAVDLGRWMRDEKDPILREEIVRALARIDAPTAKRLLGAALQDPVAPIRVAAVEAIAEQGGPGAVEILGAALQKDDNIDVRLAAARGLGKLKDPRAMPALAAALESPDPALQYRAMQSLKSATGKDFGDDVSAWREYAQGGNPPPKPFSFAELLQGLSPF
jgi:hypothetical protein